MRVKVRKLAQSEFHSIPFIFQMKDYWWINEWPDGTACCHASFEEAMDCVEAVLRDMAYGIDDLAKVPAVSKAVN